MSQNSTVTLSSEEYATLLAAYREVATIVWEDMNDPHYLRIDELDRAVESINDRVTGSTVEVAR
jgi:hypothetical protein